MTAPISELNVAMETSEEEGEKLLTAREKYLNNIIASLPRNMEDIKKLTEDCEYSIRFWNEVRYLEIW